MTPKQIHAAARALLSPPQSWSQHAWAYDETDNRVAYDAKTACSFCLEAALRRAAKRGRASEANLERALILVRDSIHVPGHYASLQGWNDVHDRTQQQVLAVLDKAIAAAP